MAALAIGLAVLFSLIGLNRSEMISYYMEFDENVAGLAEGARVTYQGVPVGKITDLVITPDYHVKVTIGVEPRKIQLRKDIQAKLTMESLFGPIAVDLYYPADHHQPPLASGSLIPVASSLRERIESDIPRALDQLRQVMSRIDSTLGAIEPSRVAETVENLGSAVKQLDATLAKIKPEDVEGMLKKIDSLLTNTNQSLHDLRGRVDGVAGEIEKAVAKGSAEISGTMLRLVQTLLTLRKGIDETTRLVRSVHQIVEQNRETVGTSLVHARSILAKADKQLDDLDLPATEQAIRGTAEIATATIAVGGEEARRSLDNVERSVTRSLDELERSLRSLRRLIDVLERDPSALIRGKAGAGKK